MKQQMQMLGFVGANQEIGIPDYAVCLTRDVGLNHPFLSIRPI